MSTNAQRLAPTDAPGSVSRVPQADEAPEGMLECLEPFREPYTAER